MQQPINHQELWQKVLSQMELETSKANFATWFQNTTLQGIQDGTALIAVPNAFAKEWLEKKYHKSIVKALRDQTDAVRSVNYAISSLIQHQRLQKRLDQPLEERHEQLEFKEFSVDRETNLNPKYTFDSFIVGSFNELAHAAAESITKSLGTLYNPFFVYGGVGLGKTHLLQAIGNEVKRTHPNYRILYLTSEKFMNELITLIQNREPLGAFKEKYRAVDLLIIDDIQFIAGKNKTEEEFFHTFNALYESGKQIVFSSDKPPQIIPNLEARLRSRFEAGLIVDIGQPEYESRLAILKAKALEKHYVPPDEVLEYIASLIQQNIRELEGALNILIAKTRIRSQPLTVDEAKQTLEQLNLQAQRIVTTSQILKTVAEFYGIEEKDLYARSRKREVVKPRQIAMYLLREDFHGSYPYIGQKLGGRDHTTALHAHDKVTTDLKKNGKLVEEIRLIREKLYKSGT